MSLSAEIVAHHLRLFGFPRASCASLRDGEPLILGEPTATDLAVVQRSVSYNCPVVALRPHDSFLSAFGLAREEIESTPPIVTSSVDAAGSYWHRLRSLHPVTAYRSVSGGSQIAPIVRTAGDKVVWGWHAVAGSGLLIVGTDLPADLIRYRQGDPDAGERRENTELWGFPGERPVYLFEAQLEGENPRERHADWWCWALRDALQRYAGLEPVSLFPGNAPGAIVVTGDDDQAQISNYEAQLEELGPLPITYFLHPLTKHNRDSMDRLFAGRNIDLGLHPDALDEPHRYPDLCAAQARWFEQLVGRPSLSLRNHGYLNDGYWGHLPTWLAHGFRISPNLPGLDGRVLNGSLLPARVSWNGCLTQHWSILSAIEDGVVFIQGKLGREAGNVVRNLGHEVVTSKIPGVIVVNLHPDNIAHTRDMHIAVHELHQEGFLAWNMADLLAWCIDRDRDWRDT